MIPLNGWCCFFVFSTRELLLQIQGIAKKFLSLFRKLKSLENLSRYINLICKNMTKMWKAMTIFRFQKLNPLNLTFLYVLKHLQKISFVILDLEGFGISFFLQFAHFLIYAKPIDFWSIWNLTTALLYKFIGFCGNNLTHVVKINN